MKQQLWGIVAALIIGFLAGVGTMQMTMASDVRVNGLDISYLKQQTKANADLFEHRLDNVIELWSKSVEQQTELIRLMRENLIVEKANLTRERQQK